VNRVRTALLVVLLTVLEFHVLSVIHFNKGGGPWTTSIAAFPYELATGTFDMLHCAQRVLLPKVLLFVVRATGWSAMHVWLGAVFGMLLASNALTLWLLGRHAATKPFAAFYTFAQAAVFVALQEFYVLPPYDLVDNLTWFLFALGVFGNARWWWFAVLFVVELHNREVALYFALWVALQNLLPLQFKLRPLLTGCAALACVPLGFAYTVWLRAACLTVPVPPRVGLVYGECVSWKGNLTAFRECFPGTPWTTMWMGHTRYEIWTVIAALALTAVAFTYLKRGWFAARFVVFVGAFWAAILYSTIVMEVRAFSVLTPLLLFAVFLRGRDYELRYQDGTSSHTAGDGGSGGIASLRGIPHFN
jgi:hypothetical protein